jgi:hypothetical protein
MQFTPPRQGPRTWLGRISFSVLFALLSPVILLPAIAAVFPLAGMILQSYQLSFNISVLSSERHFMMALLGAILSGGFYGWIVAGADRERWRFHLRIFQWGGLIVALVAGVMCAVLLHTPMGPFPYFNIAILAHMRLAELAVIATAATVGSIVFLANFWWGKGAGLPFSRRVERRSRGSYPHPQAKAIGRGCFRK